MILRKTLLLFFFTTILGVYVHAQQIISTPEGSFRDILPEDFLAKNLPSKYYNELYTYQINLENGVQIIYSFSINDFGSLKDRVTGGKLSIHWLDGKNYVANKEYPIERFVNESDSNKIILHTERNYWAKGSFDDEHILNFKTTKNGVSYDVNLILYDIAKGKIWGNGVYKTDETEFGLSFLIPHAKVKGYVSVNGQRISAKGFAVMDHIYQNNLSTKFIKKSYRVKTGDDQNGTFLHFITVENNGYLIPLGYGLRYNKGNVTMLTPSKIIPNLTKKTHGVQLDTDFQIKSYQTETLHFKLTDHFDSYSILDELGGFKRRLAKRFVGGEVVEINGLGTLNNAPASFLFMVVDN